MDVLEMTDMARSAEQRLKVVLGVLGDSNLGEETITGCAWILGDILEIISALAQNEPELQEEPAPNEELASPQALKVYRFER